ncbi:hypothetical protein NST20_13040 [Weizmannia sp. FSL W8-0676]|uniref:hypothetical protein n=1 Tax=Weizmannia sp. FSL W8-0676 TaxID=2954703 RepID=UPI00315961F9
MRKKIGITIKDTGDLGEVIKNIEKLKSRKIKVGVFSGEKHEESEIDMADLARIHEYGMTINPKNGKYLAIPSHPKAKGKSPRDFNDLFFIETEKGNGLLAKEKGKDSFDVYFVLVKSVTIPERSFLRSGYDENIDKIYKKIKDMMPDVIANEIDPEFFMDSIGEEFAGLIRKKLVSIKSPPKSKVTLAASPGKTNPLQDTGQLVESIRHEIE